MIMSAKDRIYSALHTLDYLLYDLYVPSRIRCTAAYPLYDVHDHKCKGSYLQWTIPYSGLGLSTESTLYGNMHYIENIGIPCTIWQHALYREYWYPLHYTAAFTI